MWIYITICFLTFVSSCRTVNGHYIDDAYIQGFISHSSFIISKSVSCHCSLILLVCFFCCFIFGRTMARAWSISWQLESMHNGVMCKPIRYDSPSTQLDSLDSQWSYTHTHRLNGDHTSKIVIGWLCHCHTRCICSTIYWHSFHSLKFILQDYIRSILLSYSRCVNCCVNVQVLVYFIFCLCSLLFLSPIRHPYRGVDYWTQTKLETSYVLVFLSFRICPAIFTWRAWSPFYHYFSCFDAIWSSVSIVMIICRWWWWWWWWWCPIRC